MEITANILLEVKLTLQSDLVNLKKAINVEKLKAQKNVIINSNTIYSSHL